MQVNTETGLVEVAPSSGEDNQKWTYKPNCEGGVTLTNVGTATTFNWSYDTKEKTLMNEDGQFAYSAKRYFSWEATVRYLRDAPNKPWKRFEWDMMRA